MSKPNEIQLEKVKCKICNTETIVEISDAKIKLIIKDDNTKLLLVEDMAKDEKHEFRLLRSDAHENHLTVYCDDILIRLEFKNKTDIDKCNDFFKKEYISTDIQKTVVKDAFESEFKKNKFYDEFSNYLHESIEKWILNEDKIYSPFSFIIQSSGHGKSRCISEFSKANFCIYISLVVTNSHTYPDKSDLSDIFLTSLDNEENAIEFLTTLIIKNLNLIQKMKSDDKIDNKYIEFNKYQAWNNLEQKYQDLTKSEGNQIAEPKEKKIKNDAIGIIKDLLVTTNTKLFVFLDDASSLLQKSQTKIEGSEEYLTKFRLLRRVASKFFRSLSILFVISSTNSHLGEFVSNKFTISESERPYNKPNDSDYNIASPFYKILFIDDLVPLDYFDNLNSNLFTNLTEKDPFKGLFNHGRALWGALIEAINRTNKDQNLLHVEFQNLMNFVIRKLIFCEKWSNLTKFNKLFAAIAVLSVRTTFNISFKIPESTKMITKHLSTLYFISSERTECEYRYFSEPILASASAQIMSNENDYYDILDRFNYYIQETDLEVTGGLGEIISQLILLRAYDKAALDNQKQIKQNKYYTNSVTVKDFLIQLFGSEIENINKINKDILSGLVSFNHFIKRIGSESSKTLDYDVILRKFVARCAAGHFENQHEGIDFFIPIVLKNNEISYLLVQTKNWKSNKLNVDDIDKKFESSIKTKLFLKNKKIDVIRIIFFIGNEIVNKDNIEISKKVYLIFDTKTLKASKLFNDKTVGLINTILWSNRFNLNDKKYDREVIKRVAIGSAEFQ